MDPSQLLSLLTWFVLVFLYGFFTEAQRAIFSLRREDVEELNRSDDRRSRALQSLLKTPRETSISLLVLQRLTLLGVLLYGWRVWQMNMGHFAWPSLFLLLPIISIAVKYLMAPRTLGASPRLYAHWAAWPLWSFHRIMGPLRWTFRKLASSFSSLLGFSMPARDEEAIEREYLGLLEAGIREGIVESDEGRLIESVLELGERPVSSVMTPRADMFCLPATMDVQEAIEQVREKGYSRVPVYQKDKDHIIGILYAKDLLKIMAEKGAFRGKGLKEMIHEPFFVEMDISIEALIREFQKRRLHMAICLDGYGGVAGLVTMEDLLEEIFGEIYDEYDMALRQWEPLGEGIYRISGKMPLDELEELLQVDLSEPDCRTAAGFVLKRLGRLPQKGEKVEWEGLSFQVERVSGNRIHSIVVRKEEGEGT